MYTNASTFQLMVDISRLLSTITSLGRLVVTHTIHTPLPYINSYAPYNNAFEVD
jgi:hypothetical protein